MTSDAAKKREQYARGRKQRAARMAKISAEGREIGEIPKVADPGRRKEALSCTQAFAEIYLAQMFTTASGERWPWSPTHIEVFQKIDEAVKGGLFVVAMPRGGAKTSCIMAGTIRAVLGGLHPWVCPIAATGPKAIKIVQNIQIIFETNQLLLEDFPEAIYPIRKLERNAVRSRMQTYQDKPTRIEWHSGVIMLPDIPGSPSAGAIITATSLEAAGIRGQLKVMPDGTTRRPTLVLPDDPQTDETAASPYQTDNRWDLLNGAVMHMTPPDRPMCALAAVTVIKEDDLADRMLKDPRWNGVRRPMLVSFPVHRSATPQEIPHADFWDKYAAELRDNRVKQADQIYADHACKPECVPLLDQPRPCKECDIRMTCMDADAIVSWRHRKFKSDRTAVQHAMNLHILQPRVFAAEMQQRPLGARMDSARITPAQVMRRISGLRMGDVPAEAVHLVAAIDVHKSILYYVACAFERDYTGQVIEYGTLPKQPARWFRQADPPHPLSRDFPGLDDDARIFAAVELLCQSLLKREWFKRSVHGATPMLVEKLLVDGRYGTKLIHNVRRKLRLPAMETILGVGIGPNKKPITLYDRSRSVGNLIGDNWYRPLTTGTQEFPHVMADVNYWKTQTQRALSLAPGTRGALTLFGEPGSEADHEPFAEQVAGSEYPREMPPDSYGRVVTVYEQFPNHPDNHWFDPLVYCHVAASILGCQWPVEGKVPVAPKIVRPRPMREQSSYRNFDPAMG